MEKSVPITRLRELFELDSDVGVLTWRVSKGSRARAGCRAGSVITTTGYRTVGIDGRPYLESRVIFALAHGRWPSGYVDHINGDIQDNRVSNLREATHGQNNVNTSVAPKNSTGFKGVYFDKRRGNYRAKVGNRTYVGTFPSAELAHEAYKAAVKRIYGEFVRAA